MEALRERFGKYHVLEKIAQGGMAEVYKVKTVGIAGFEKVQALKRILPHSAREGRFIRSFIDEARIAVELSHRNIVQVFDFGKADGELFLAMELIEGKDLRTVLGEAAARDLPPSAAIAAYIVAEVAAGLDYAHRKTDVYGGSLNIVHCDVSPSNVMLSTDGYVKILDFGIARATFASALERRRLRGKPRYMAPEQTLGEPPTAASDVFALGIIAWELFTGLPLYRGPDLRAILEAVRHTVPPRIDRVKPDVPREIVDAVARALQREPAARGAVGDLLAACARTALAGGARVLSAWLAELEQRRPSSAAIGWQPEVTSVSVPRPAPPVPVPELPASRSSARSITRSLADVAAPTPAPAPIARPTPAPVPARPAAPVPARPAAVAAVAAATGTPGFVDVDDEGLEVPTAVATTPYARRFEPPSAPPPRRGPEPTVSLSEAQLPPFVEGVTGPIDRLSFLQLDPEAEDTSFDRELFADAGGSDGAGDGADPGTPDPDADPRDAEPPGARAAADDPIDDDLGALAAAPVAERRRTVVVAGTLAGAPTEVLRTVTRSLGELAYQRGGVVLGLDDDALVIAFGLEVAGEDDVAVAMGWALDAGAMARDVGVAGAGGLALRIGARTGVPAQTGAPLPADAVEEARALAREAAPDRPLFVGSAGRLTSSLYALREVAAPRRIARRSRVTEVLGPRSFDERDRGRFERRGAFLGRGAQLAELEAQLARAVAADRRLTALVTGPAGIGKSRLVAELIARRTAEHPGIRVIGCAATPAGRLTPFALVVDLYQAALRLPPARGRSARAQVVQRLTHLLGKAGVPGERVRAIATDLDRAMELRDGVGIGARELADLRPRVSAGLAMLRAATADRGRPLILFVEDIHFADSASLEVLRHALAMPAGAPELLVMTARPPDDAEATALPLPPADLTIALGDLVGGDLRALIADRLGDAATPLNIAAVLARGGGNPLFVEELVSAVRDAGQRGEEVPATARDVVSARIERLSPKARAALRFAAVLGGTIRAHLLEEVIGEEALEAELDELVRAGLLARSDSSGASEGELHFARGLIREVVYDQLTGRERRERHAQIGRLLASRFFAGREEPPAAIAEHLERGGELAGASAFWLRAGRLALTASDATAAAACFTRTLGLERELGAVPPTAPSLVRRREALAGREEAHRLVGDLATDAGDLDDLERLCGGDPARLADVAIRRAQRLLRLGDYAGSGDATVLAEQRALAAGDDRARGEALRVRGELLERQGRFDEALAAVGAARELFHRRRLVADEMAAMLGRGRIHLLRADYEAARDSYRPVLALIEQTGDPWLERIATNHLAVIDMCLGNFERAMAAAERSLELCRRHGDRAREGDGLSVTGIILLEVGLLDEAAAAFAEALDLLARMASRWSRADCLIYAGTCEVRRGRPGGLALIDEAVAEARRLGARYLEANALVARAGAQLRRGALAAAIDDAAAGTEVAQAATLAGYEIQGLARHALALARLGRAAEAAPLAQRALARFDRQRYLEGSEEEVLGACAEVLRAAGAAERARSVLDRARVSAQRKLDALTEPAWRAAFLAAPHIRELFAQR